MAVSGRAEKRDMVRTVPHSQLARWLTARRLPQVCVASGRIIRDVPDIKCRVCRHSMIAAEVRARVACPLCHSELHTSGPAAAAAGGSQRSMAAAKLGHGSRAAARRSVAGV